MDFRGNDCYNLIFFKYLFIFLFNDRIVDECSSVIFLPDYLMALPLSRL